MSWFDPQPFPDTLIDLLSLVGKWYVPYLVANDLAFKEAKSFEVELNDGKFYGGSLLYYQSKCLG